MELKNIFLISELLLIIFYRPYIFIDIFNIFIYKVNYNKFNGTKYLHLGDIGYFNKHTYNIFNTISESSELDTLVLVGDNFYPNGVTSESDELWKNLEKPI